MVEIITKNACADLYKLAAHFEKEGDKFAALKIYELLIGTKYNDVAILKLNALYMACDYYAMSRAVLEQMDEKESLEYYSQMAYLEMMELNFTRALSYCEHLTVPSSNLENALFHCIQIKKSQGEFEVAKNMAEALQKMGTCKKDVFSELCGIAVVQKDNAQLQRLLEMAPFVGNKGNCKSTQILQRALGDLDSVKKDGSYSMQRYFDTDEQRLYTHLEKHIEGNKEGDYFFKYLHLPAFIEDIYKKMEVSNPLFLGTSYHYHLKMNTAIGISNRQMTDALCIIRPADSSNIITMYPILPSNEFNREKFLEDKKILEKRKGGLA